MGEAEKRRRKRRKYLEKEKEENIQRRKIFGVGKYTFVKEKKNRKGNGGKHLEKENVTMAGQTTTNE